MKIQTQEILVHILAIGWALFSIVGSGLLAYHYQNVWLLFLSGFMFLAFFIEEAFEPDYYSEYLKLRIPPKPKGIGHPSDFYMNRQTKKELMNRINEIEERVGNFETNKSYKEFPKEDDVDLATVCWLVFFFGIGMAIGGFFAYLFWGCG